MLKKLLLFSFLTFVGVHLIWARSFTSCDSIPVDPRVKCRTLNNGFTYFLCKNNIPEDKIYLQLTVRAGTINENDEQRELAHFLEHMAFSGSSHFPDIYKTMQSYGVTRGSEINGNTGDVYTRYFITLPSQNDEAIADALLFLRDCAQGIKFDSVKIQIERGIVLAEIRRGTPEFMLDLEYRNSLLQDSTLKRSDRTASELSIETFKKNSLIDYYNDWYRPDMQCLSIVGNFDLHKVEGLAERLFSDLKKSTFKRKLGTVSNSLLSNNSCLILSNSNYPRSTVRFDYINGYSGPIRTRSDITTVVLSDMINILFRNRLKYLATSSHQVPDFNIYINKNLPHPGPELNSLSLDFVFDSTTLKEYFRWAFTEFNRAVTFGFSASEMEKARKEFARSNVYISSVTSSEITNHIASSFVENLPVFDIDSIQKSALSIANNVDSALIKKYLSDFLKNSTRYITFLVNDSSRHFIPGEKLVNIWLEESKKNAIEAGPFNREENSDDLCLFSKTEINALTAGSLVIDSFSLGISRVNLSNGISIYVKPLLPHTEENKIIIGGFNKSLQGMDSCFEKLYDRMNRMIYKQGLDRLSYNQLQQLLKEKNIDFQQLGSLSPMIIKMRPQDAEIGFQLAYRYLTKSNLYSELKDSMKFIIAGDFRLADIIPFVNAYFGNIHFDPNASFLKDSCSTSGYMSSSKAIGAYSYVEKRPGMSTIIIEYAGVANFDINNNMLLEIVNNILNEKLIDRLRNKTGNVYAVDVHAVQNPNDSFIVKVQFECLTKYSSVLLEDTYDEIKKMTKDISQDVINRAVSKYKTEMKIRLQSPDYWAQLISRILMGQLKVRDVNDFFSIPETIGLNASGFIRRYLSRSNAKVSFITSPAFH